MAISQLVISVILPILVLVPVVSYLVLRYQQFPSVRLIGVIFVGSHFPDLIDKPLAHQFGLIPSGRVFMHSLPIAVPFLCGVAVYGWKTERQRLSTTFIFAYASHIMSDNYTALMGSDRKIPADLLWPFVEATPRSAVPFWAGPEGSNIVAWTAFSIVILSVVLYTMVLDLRRQFERRN